MQIHGNSPPMRKGHEKCAFDNENINSSFLNVTPTLFDKCFVTFIRSHRGYSFHTWRPSFKTDIRLLGDVQRRSTKLVQWLQDIEYEERAKLLNLDSLSCSMNKGNMILVFKIFHGFLGDVQLAAVHL